MSEEEKELYKESYFSYPRPNDGKVFRVGEEVICTVTGKSFGVLTRIWRSLEQIRGDIGNMGLVIYAPNRKNTVDPII